MSFPAIGGSTTAVEPAYQRASLNVSVIPQGRLGYLTIWPTDEVRPVVATLNSLDGRIKADAAIVPAGTSGAVSVYVTDTTNVVLDINGYFAPVSGSTLAFYPLTPCRIADTRKTNFPQGLGAPFLPGQQERDFPILNATTCNIPSSAEAYSLNFSVVPHGGLGYMTVWPTGQSRPLVSTLNDVPGTIIANAAIVPAPDKATFTPYFSNKGLRTARRSVSGPWNLPSEYKLQAAANNEVVLVHAERQRLSVINFLPHPLPGLKRDISFSSAASWHLPQLCCGPRQNSRQSTNNDQPFSSLCRRTPSAPWRCSGSFNGWLHSEPVQMKSRTKLMILGGGGVHHCIFCNNALFIRVASFIFEAL